MAINFETVAGNQTSANVLAQINNNFAKINSNPVPKADFATNADTVDNKHASELIPGAATFLNSITSLANLSIGRYFCTQTRQSWEPVTTTGSRTFLIEVSLDTPNSLKSYKINYIAGAGAGESYYSDYSSGSIRWNRIVTDENISTFDDVKYTFNQNNVKGIVTTEDSYIYLDTVSDQNFVPTQHKIPIPESDGSWQYYYDINVAGTVTSSSTSCGSTSNTSTLVITVYLKQISNNTTVKTYTKTLTGISTSTDLASGATFAGTVTNFKVNMSNKDLIFKILQINSSYDSNILYLSSDSSNTTILYITSSSVNIDNITYWYDNVFGDFEYYSSRDYIYCIATKLNSTRTAYDSYVSQKIDSGPGVTRLGQKGGYYYYHSGTRIVRFDITNTSVLVKTFPITNYTASYSQMDNNNIYCLCYLSSSSTTQMIFKYDLSLNLVAQTTNFTGGDYLTLTDNYVITNTRIYNKSNLSLKSTGAALSSNFQLTVLNGTYYYGTIDSFGPNVNKVVIYGPKIQKDYYISRYISVTYLFNISISCAEIVDASTGKSKYITNTTYSNVKVQDYFGVRDIYIKNLKTNFNKLNSLFLYFKEA